MRIIRILVNWVVLLFVGPFIGIPLTILKIAEIIQGKADNQVYIFGKDWVWK